MADLSCTLAAPEGLEFGAEAGEGPDTAWPEVTAE